MQILNLIIKYPNRRICKIRGHILRKNSGLFGLFAPKYSMTCERCGKRSQGDYDSMKKVFGDSNNNRWIL